MNRLAAFTLLEVILSLLLVAMLGMFAFYILQGMLHGTHQLSTRTESEQEVLFLSAAVRADLDRAVTIHPTENGSMECIHTEGKTIYSANATGIQRIGPHGDTVHFALPVERHEMHTLAPDIPLVDLWRITLAGEAGSIAFAKIYAPADRVREHVADGH